jgi:hypothetical protein
MMKKIIALMMFAGLSSSVFATAVCAGNTSAVAGTIQNPTAGTTFNVVAFTPRCSANVFLDVEQSPINVGVGSASSKGKNVFGGNSGGGSVAPTGTLCPAAGCSATQTGTAATNALAAAGAST